MGGQSRCGGRRGRRDTGRSRGGSQAWSSSGCYAVPRAAGRVALPRAAPLAAAGCDHAATHPVWPVVLVVEGDPCRGGDPPAVAAAALGRVAEPGVRARPDARGYGLPHRRVKWAVVAAPDVLVQPDGGPERLAAGGADLASASPPPGVRAENGSAPRPTARSSQLLQPPESSRMRLGVLYGSAWTVCGGRRRGPLRVPRPPRRPRRQSRSPGRSRSSKVGPACRASSAA